MRGYKISRISISNSTSVAQGNQKRYATEKIKGKDIPQELTDEMQIFLYKNRSQ